jgi:hypothetical protein
MLHGRFRKHVDDLAGHRVHDQHLMLELEIGVPFQQRHFVDQRRRQRMRFQGGRNEGKASVIQSAKGTDISCI